MRARWRMIAVFCLVFLSRPSLAEPLALGQLSAVKDDPSTKVRWSAPEAVPIELEDAASGQKFVARLSGTLAERDSNLVYSRSKLAIAKDGVFSFSVPIEAAETEFQVFEVDKRGNLSPMSYRIRIQDWESLAAQLRTPAPRKYSFFLGAGPTLLSYSQTTFQDFSATLINVKGGFSYLLVPKEWDLGASAYFTALPLSISSEGVTFRFFGFNGRAGYITPWLSDPWQLTLMAGVYYATTLVSDESFGYANLIGPMLYPTLRRKFSSGRVLGFYLKYSPITDRGRILTLANRELALGASWDFTPNPGQRRFSLQLDFANLKAKSTLNEVGSTTYSLALGYSW